MKPMGSLRIQGFLFSLCALGAAAFFACVGFQEVNFTGQSGLIILATLILLLGVPHGAFDTIFAYKLYDLRKPTDWMLFTMIYLLLAAVVVAVWWWAPMGFLILFLLISSLFQATVAAKSVADDYDRPDQVYNLLKIIIA